MRYVNAGHNPPIVIHRDGSHDRLEEGGIVLGVFPSQASRRAPMPLEPGDRVILFTDGVTEAGNVDGEEFGETRLVQLVSANRTAGAKEIQGRILSAAARV